MTDLELQELMNLRLENEKLKKEVANKAKSGGIKISTKGGISVYGLGRFPVTLYSKQWDKLLGKAEEIKKFIEANKDKLTTKDE